MRIFLIALFLFFIMIMIDSIATNFQKVSDKYLNEFNCTKTQTNMIEIDGVKKDFLICTAPEVRIVKEY
jgi:hypothetical protein